jgi:hypothetical protein
MIPIEIDISEVIEEFNQVNEDDLSSVVIAAAISEIHNEIALKASAGLNTTKQAYLNGIISGMDNSKEGYVELVGSLPNMVENGVQAYDIKYDLLNGPNVKTAQDGSKYIDVPFQHGTPNASPSNPNFSSIMPRNIYNLAKNLGPGEKLGNAGLPGSRPEIKDSAGGTMYAEYKHLFSIHEGMQRQMAPGSSRASGYMTFRRVSENSDPLSWIHKGIKAHNYFDDAVGTANIDFVVDRAIDNYLAGLGL